MAKPKKKLSKEEKLAKDRLRKKEKYANIKNDPELYALQKEKEKKRYLLRKEKNKICSIKDMTPRAQREQRKRWRKNSIKYLEKKKEAQRIERIIVENSPPPSETGDMEVEYVEQGVNLLVEENDIDPTRQSIDPKLLQEIEKSDPLLEQNSKEPPRKPTNPKPLEEVVQEHDPLVVDNIKEPNRQPTNPKVLMRRLRYRHMKTVKNLKLEIIKLKNEIKEIKNKEKKKHNEHDRTERQVSINNEDSVVKRVNEIISDINSEKVDEIRKKLLFGEIESKNIKQEYKTLEKKKKKVFMENILQNRDKFKKYRILSKAPFPYRKQLQKAERINTLPDKIKDFLEDDANSSLAPGKKEFKKVEGVKKQKRYLRDNLSNLHEKFCKEVVKVAYSTFCKYRPLWIVTPNTRDTCLCRLHTNVDLLIGALKKAAITKECSGADILKSICCNTNSETCLDRKCKFCQNRVVDYKEFSNNEKIVYFQWLTEKQTYKTKDGKEKISTVTIKKELKDYPRNIILNFEESMLPKYLLHTKNICMQYASIKDLKRNLKHDEILIHIDFSENYCLKHNAEIQAFHFGGSRGQVSLHTGVLYYINAETKLISTKSFCTASKCVQHDAASVWAHLNPVLEMAKELVPGLKAIHFLSDSPTSQYRNKYIFYMITKINEKLTSIETVTWNYLEAGHGKGAPDGIGAVVKRTADNFVKHGGDVGSFEDFVGIIGQNTNISIDVIEEDKILNTKFPQNIPTFKGTMNVHQVIWCFSLPHCVAFRKLSCFICQSSYIPCSHNRHLGVLSIGIDNRTTCQSNNIQNVTSELNITNDKIINTQSKETQLPQSFDADVDEMNDVSTKANSPLQSINDVDYLNIDSPTIRNNISNIDDSILLNEIDDQAFLADSKPATPRQTESPNTQILPVLEPHSNDRLRSPPVQILSNVPFDWQRYTFYKKKSRSFNQCDQAEFKKFICGTSPTAQKIQTRDSILAETDNTGCDNIIEHLDISETYTEKKDTASVCDFNKENIAKETLQRLYNIGDWVIVQYQIKSKSYAYIGKIKEHTNGTYTINFLKKSLLKPFSFSWPTVDDEDTISESRVLCSLSTPNINRRGQYFFDNIPDLNYR